MADLQEKVSEFLDEVTSAWARNDGAAVGACFTEDGSLINPFGDRADGRTAVAAMYGQFFGGMLRGTSTRFSAITVHAVGDDHAFLDCDQVIEGGEFTLNGHLSAVLRNSDGTWQFVDARPHSYLDPAG